MKNVKRCFQSFLFPAPLVGGVIPDAQWVTRRGSGQDLRSGFFWPKPFLRYPMAGFGIFFLHVVTIGLVIPL